MQYFEYALLQLSKSVKYQDKDEGFMTVIGEDKIAINLFAYIKF